MKLKTISSDGVKCYGLSLCTYQESIQIQQLKE